MKIVNRKVTLNRLKNGIITLDFMGEFDRSMKPSNIIENTAMRYSAAYPMGAERIGI